MIKAHQADQVVRRLPRLAGIWRWRQQLVDELRIAHLGCIMDRAAKKQSGKAATAAAVNRAAQIDADGLLTMFN